MGWIEYFIDKVDRRVNAIEKAKQLGTYNAIDRSRQYEQVSNADLVRAVNEAFTKLRTHERTLAPKDEITALRKQVESRIWHRIVLIVATAEFTLIVALLSKLH